MHAAKAEGRSGYRVFAIETHKKLERRLDVELRLRDALASGVGLELHYHPQVGIRGQRVKANEALLRSSPHARGPIAPLELVSVTEDNGLIHELGDFVLRTACSQAKRWLDTGSKLTVAVNVSAHQFESADFADHVALSSTKHAFCRSY